MIRSQAAIPPGRAILGECLFGPQSGFAFGRATGSGGPCRGLCGTEPTNSQLPKDVCNSPGRGEPLGDRVCLSPGV